MKSSAFSSVKIGTKVAAAMFLAVGGLFSIFVALTNASSQRHAEREAVLHVTEKSRLFRTTVEVLDQSLRT